MNSGEGDRRDLAVHYFISKTVLNGLTTWDRVAGLIHFLFPFKCTHSNESPGKVYWHDDPSVLLKGPREADQVRHPNETNMHLSESDRFIARLPELIGPHWYGPTRWEQDDDLRVVYEHPEFIGPHWREPTRYEKDHDQGPPRMNSVYERGSVPSGQNTP